MPDTTHWIYARVDPADNISEWDETNNTASLPAVTPDLWVGSTLVTPLGGEQFEIAARIENSGTAPAPPANVEFRRSAITGTLLSSVPVGQIAADDGRVVTANVDANSLSAGSYPIYIVADAQAAVVEADEENNAGYATLNVLPDLAVGPESIQFSKSSNGRYGVSLTVHNLGLRPARDVDVALTRGNPLDGPAPVVLEEMVGEIPAGGEATISRPWRGSWDTGDAYLQVDGGQAIVEMDESNNLATRPHERLPRVFVLFLPLVMRNANPGSPPPDITPTSTPTPPRPTATATSIFSPGRTPTPTMSPTTAVTPTPTSSASPITLTRVETTDEEFEQRMAFVSLNTIRLRLRVENSGSGPVDVDASWEVRMPDGSLLDWLSWNGTITIDPEQPWWGLERQIPTDLPSGQYTFTGSVTYAGQTQTQTAVFYLADSLERADDFSDSSSGWPTADTASYRGGYVNDQYRVLVKTDGLSVWVWPGASQSLVDFVLEADGRFDSDVSGHYGLVLDLSDDHQNFYSLHVSSSGFYRIRKHTASGWQILRDWTSSQVLNDGQEGNHLMVVRRGDRIGVYANGQFLGEVTDSSLPSGWVGLITGTFTGSPNADVYFDNFRLYSVGSSGLATGAGPADERREPGSGEATELPPMQHP